jgi:hypothetical protein
MRLQRRAAWPLADVLGSIGYVRTLDAGGQAWILNFAEIPKLSLRTL